MKTKIVYLIMIVSILLSACSLSRTTPAQASAAQPQAVQPVNALSQSIATPSGAQGQHDGGGTPPQAAITACASKAEQATCEFTSDKGTETGVCETVQNQLACSPKHSTADSPQSGNNNGNPTSAGGPQPGNNNNTQQGAGQTDKNGNAYNIEQAISDKAQGMTIAYDALAFMTGDLGSDSFFPPGKVADFWGFQYLRDNDPSEMGHAGDFLTSAAMNMLNVLTADQRAKLVALAKSQVSSINDYGYKRFVLMEAFRRLVKNDLPSGTTSLNEDAVKTYSADLYKLDGQISYARAQMMGELINSLTTDQKAYLDKMVGKGMKEWPIVTEPADIKGLDRDVKVAVMTYAADTYSWYAGSVEADVYFCPERHGTYFGSFYLKDIPAMGNPDYAIPTNLTGDMGESMIKTLNTDQAKTITGLIDIQKPYLEGIVETRKHISTELRKFKDGGSADSATVLGLMEKYGQLDGEIIYNLAINFSKVSQNLTADQKAKLMAYRKEMLGDLMYPKGAYLYSEPIAMPQISNTDFLFK